MKRTSTSPLKLDPYASLWRRAAAALFDGILGLAISVGITFVFGVVFGTSGLYVAIVLSAVLWLLYSAGMESSDMQSTLGGRIFSTRVSDTNGQRVSFWRAGARQATRVGLVLLVVAAEAADVTALTAAAALIPVAAFTAAAFLPKKQAFYDLAARTIVTSH